MIGLTISGADDDVDPRQLVDIWRSDPWVEFGILVSSSRQGSARYPSRAWRDRLVSEAPPEMRLSMHLCGAVASDVVRALPGGPISRWLPPEPSRFQRVQLNGYFKHAADSRIGSCPEEVIANLRTQSIACMPPFDWIIQATSPTELRPALADANAIGNACVLLDASGGRGTADGFQEWFSDAEAFCRGPRVGFAGGIDLRNIRRVLDQVHGRSGWFAREATRGWWIDLESGARDADDRFCLATVREIVSVAGSWRSENLRSA